MAHSHTRVAATLCQRAQKPHPVTRAPSMPMWTESGQRAGGTTAGVCQCCVPSPAPGNTGTNRQTDPWVDAHGVSHTDATCPDSHTRGDGRGHTSAGHSHAQTRALPGKAVTGIHASALTHLAPGPSPRKQLAFSGQRAPRAAPAPAPPGPGCQEASWKYHCQGAGTEQVCTPTCTAHRPHVTYTCVPTDSHTTHVLCTHTAHGTLNTQ